MLRRLITTNNRRKPPRPDIWCHSFARHLGRQLTPAEKAVIAPIEQQRRARHPRPIMVIDHGRTDSADILRSYLDYRLATSPSGATALLITPSTNHRQRNPRLRHATYRRPESHRGSTPAYMLLLNAHQAKTFSPLRHNTAGFRRLSTALFPILDRSGFLIIHLRADSPPKNLPPGLLIQSSETARQRDDDDSPPLVTVITLAPRPPVLPSLCSCALVSRSPVSPHPPPL